MDMLGHAADQRTFRIIAFLAMQMLGHATGGKPFEGIRFLFKGIHRCQKNNHRQHGNNSPYRAPSLYSSEHFTELAVLHICTLTVLYRSIGVCGQAPMVARMVSAASDRASSGSTLSIKTDWHA